MVAAQDTGAEDFLSAVWPGGELLIDEDESFKKALGGTQYRNSWLLKPSVILRIAGVKRFGTSMDDLNAKSNMLGGVVVMGKDGVVYAEAESTSFAMPKADAILSALRAASSSSSEPACTPAQAEVA